MEKLASRDPFTYLSFNEERAPLTRTVPRRGGCLRKKPTRRAHASSGKTHLHSDSHRGADAIFSGRCLGRMVIIMPV